MTTATPFDRLRTNPDEQTEAAKLRLDEQRNDLVSIAETDHGVRFLARLWRKGAFPFPKGIHVPGDPDATTKNCVRHEDAAALAHELYRERPDLYDRVIREVSNGR